MHLVKKMQLLTISLHYAKIDCFSIWCKEFSIISTGCCVSTGVHFRFLVPALIIFSNIDIFFLQLGQSSNTCMLFEHMNNWKIRLQGKLFWQKTKKIASRCFTLPFVGIFHLKCLYQRKRDLELCAVLYSLHQPLLATGTEPTENTKQSFRHLRQGNNNINMEEN